RLSRAIESALARGLSVVLIAERGEVAGCAVVGDEIRPEASRCLARLRSLGWNTVLLSGDHERIVRSVGAQLGFEDSMMVGEASPQVKAEVVRGLRADGPTIMIGDGVNDAAALAAATVGVAVQGGAEAAMSSADVYLSRPGLEGLVGLVERARRTTGAIRRNLAVSLLYNVLFGSLAMAGMVNPLVAAVLMPLSSLTVIVLSFHHREAMGRSTRTEGTR
ncbi:MAG: cation-translocating P-type ATPase, partial [Phycisphaerae bacterium]|nr:cation-translocating P-type ATPase [Phycisphaerae bacterium]